MHDTPQRDLFEKTVRAYSHGCIRVQNPGRLAEILLEEDKGWSAAHVRDLLAQGGNNEVTLTKQIPVHITYFTVMVGDDGRLQSFGDLYGHDNRVAVGIGGPAVAAGGAVRYGRVPERFEGSAARQGLPSRPTTISSPVCSETSDAGAWPCRRIGCQVAWDCSAGLLLAAAVVVRLAACRVGPLRRFASWRLARLQGAVLRLEPAM